MVWSYVCLKNKFKLAPRRPVRALRRCLRGALLASCVGLANPSVAETIVGASFEGPTTRYTHGVLGDAIEFTALVIETERQSSPVLYRVNLPEDHVFEDVEPRLWDVTGDGTPEVVVIETDMALGGSLAVYDETGKISETPHIGRSNRWLAPAGAVDLDGDGRIEIAFVDRPHLTKTLRVFEWDGTGLVFEAELVGLTNHRIDEDFISGGVRDCGTGPEFITADADWSDIMATTLDAGVLKTRSIGGFSASGLAAALDCRS